MADDRDVSVSISADASGVEAGTSAATAAVEGFGEDVGAICAAIAAQTEAMAAGFAELGATITASMATAGAATAEEEAEMRGLLATVRGGVESFNELKESVLGFGEVLIAAFAVREIAEFVNSLGEAGERVQHTAQAFGMTTGEVQRLQAVFTAAGAGPEVLGMAMMRLDRSASMAVSGNKRAADAFKAIGVDLAEPMTAAQRMQAVLAGFANIPGPNRAAVAMGVFGRQIMEIAPLLGLTKDQLEEYSAAADRFGAVNETAVGHMAALGAALNENKVAMSGLQNILGDGLSAAFIEVVQDIDNFIAGLVQSYQRGGLVHDVMQTIGVVISTVGTILEEIGEVIASVFGDFFDHTQVAHSGLEILMGAVKLCGDTVVLFGAIIESVGAAVGMVIDNMETAFRVLGEVIRDALTGHIAEIESDWDRGNAVIVARTKEAADKIAQTWADAREKGRQMGEGTPRSEASPAAVATTPEKLGGEKNARKPKDDLVSEWTEMLRQLQDQQSSWYEDQNQLAANFWAGIVAKAQGSAKDQQEARDRLAEANKAFDAEDTDSAIQAAAKKAEAAKGNVDEVRAIYAALEAELRAKHAEGGDDWRKVEAAKTEAVKKASDEQLAAQTKVWQDQARAAEQAAQTSGQVAGLQIEGKGQGVSAEKSTGKINARQELADRLELLNEEYENEVETADKITAIKVGELEQELAANASNADKVKELNAQIVEAQQQNYDRLATMAQENANKVAQVQQQAAEKTYQTWSQSIGSVVSTFGNGTLQMAQHGGTLQSVMLKVDEDIESQFVSASERMVTRWITNMVLAAVQSKAEASISSMGQITSAAGVAAANTFASISAIPIVGPAMAPAAAAAAEGEVMAFAATASAAGGFDIPAGMNPVTQLHASEMVLPASIAQPLRSMIAANTNTPSAPGSSSGGGDTHNWSVNAIDARGVRGWARSGQGKSAIKQAVGGRR